MTKEDDQSILDEYRIRAQRRPVPAQIPVEKLDTVLRETCTREVSNSNEIMGNDKYKNPSIYQLPPEKGNPTLPYPNPLLEERKKERMLANLLANYLQDQPDGLKLVPFASRVPDILLETWTEIALNIERTGKRSGKLQKALARSMNLYILMNEGKVSNSNLATLTKELDTHTTKLHSLKGSTTKLQTAKASNCVPDRPPPERKHSYIYRCPKLEDSKKTLKGETLPGRIERDHCILSKCTNYDWAEDKCLYPGRYRGRKQLSLEGI